MTTAARWTAALAATALVACGPDADDRKEDGPRPLPELAEGWNEILPGGESVCARGTEYAFFASPGTTNKVVIDFIGGGACWTEDSCSYAGSLFSDDIDDLRTRVAEGFPGVYDRTRPDNPFKDWYHVVIPYCTGDIHWGNSVVTYGEGERAVTIRHKGAVNARAVLDWVYRNFAAPEKILVTGCSAGSYGSIFWSPEIREHYSKAKVFQLGDSGAGIVTESFFRDSFPKWNAMASAPTFIPALDPATNDWTKLALPDLYTRIGAHYADMRLAQFNFSLDGTQAFFFSAMGGEGGPEEWGRRMAASITRTHESTANFSSYIAPGTQHCILPDEDFDEIEVNGVKFVDWVRDFVEGDEVPDVACDGCR